MATAKQPNISPIVLIDNYDSFTYNLFQMLQAQTSRPVVVYRNDAITWDELLALKPDRIVLSPGPGHPGIASDFGICRQVIENASALGCPVLGVCLGHQGMALHLGGDVLAAPEIVHGKTSPVKIEKKSPLFDGMSSPFEAMRYHSLLIDEKTLPACFEVTARDAVLGLPMAIAHKTLPLYGVQFHPESIGTPEGGVLLKNFLERC